jgi:hypothetical protein
MLNSVAICADSAEVVTGARPSEHSTSAFELLSSRAHSISSGRDLCRFNAIDGLPLKRASLARAAITFATHRVIAASALALQHTAAD